MSSEESDFGSKILDEDKRMEVREADVFEEITKI